jgi:signal transduction histidine kinase
MYTFNYYRGDGDLHDRQYSDLGLSIDLYSPGLFNYRAADYKLYLYPSAELFEVYSTTNPIIALFGALCIVLFTSLLFFLYDFYVRQEFHHNQAIAEAKRQYVHYISHAVRTPLNAVVMGSQLVQDDMSAFYRSKTRRTKTKGSDGSDQDCTTSALMTELQDKLTDWSSLTGEILQNTQSAVTVFNDLLNYDNVMTGEMGR